METFLDLSIRNMKLIKGKLIQKHFEESNKSLKINTYMDTIWTLYGHLSLIPKRGSPKFQSSKDSCIIKCTSK